MVVIDEMAHCDDALITDVVLPILQMKNTALLGLSSPEGSQNLFSRWINLKDDVTGEPFFRVCDCIMICEECRKLEKEEQILCNHVKQTAHWINNDKSMRLRLLYKDDPARALKEFAGMISDDIIPCFQVADIARLFTRPAYLASATPKYVFVTCDPSGGGTSQLAICSGYYDESLNFVVGFV